MRTKILTLGVALLALILSACAPAAPIYPTSTNMPAATNAPTAVVPVTGSTPATGGSSAPATVNVAQNPSLGSILVDSKGMTLYIFSQDAMNTSNCSGSCASIWPPLLTTGSLTAGTGVDKSLLGTIKRSDGGTQVTYNGMPLYTFVSDKAAGDVTGQGVEKFFVINPAGMVVNMAGASGAGSSGSGSSGAGSGSNGSSSGGTSATPIQQYPGYGPASNMPSNPGSTGSGYSSGGGW